MSDEMAGGPKTQNRFAARDFLPPAGSIKEQVELQLAFLTQGVMDSMIASHGVFRTRSEPEPYVVPAYAARFGGAKKHSDPDEAEQAARSADLRDAARMAEASARLIGAMSRLRSEFKQHYTVNHVNTVADEKDGKRRSRSTTVTGTFRIPENECAPPVADDDVQSGEPAESEMPLDTAAAEDAATKTDVPAAAEETAGAETSGNTVSDAPLPPPGS